MALLLVSDQLAGIAQDCGVPGVLSVTIIFAVPVAISPSVNTLLTVVVAAEGELIVTVPTKFVHE